jgi:uncharacterized protein with PIN domain
MPKYVPTRGKVVDFKNLEPTESTMYSICDGCGEERALVRCILAGNIMEPAEYWDAEEWWLCQKCLGEED